MCFVSVAKNSVLLVPGRVLITDQLEFLGSCMF